MDFNSYVMNKTACCYNLCSLILTISYFWVPNQRSSRIEYRVANEPINMSTGAFAESYFSIQFLSKEDNSANLPRISPSLTHFSGSDNITEMDVRSVGDLGRK